MSQLHYQPVGGISLQIVPQYWCCVSLSHALSPPKGKDIFTGDIFADDKEGQKNVSQPGELMKPLVTPGVPV